MRRRLDIARSSYGTVGIVRKELLRRHRVDHHRSRPTAAEATPRLGFESLESEVRVESLPLEGELPGVAHRLADPHRPGQVGGRRAIDEPLVRRPRDAASLRLRRRVGLLRQPLPRDQGLPRGSRHRRDRLLGVRHRPLPLAVSARDVDVLAEALRQRERQPGQARRAVHLDDRDADPGAVRRRDARDRGRRL